MPAEPGKRGGWPCVRGMRMRVMDVLVELRSAGASFEEILADDPGLERGNLLASRRLGAPPRRGEFGMTFLIDNQMPPALPRYVERHGAWRDQADGRSRNGCRGGVYPP